ncbi:hypothetical protein NQ317_005645 [Molorchus minor]|uniref:Sodium/potassium-transporting ATPase subunit alpha n=1 Tax=Molorchus minor TaxID=1323400 RepID=A0ABQ9K815_9CUCU|nr:hypothetical protein NQ317_005645 [Molorchus minor]
MDKKRQMKNRQSRSSRLSLGSVSVVKSSSTGSTYLKPLRKVRSLHQIAEFKKDFALDDHMITLEDFVNRYSTDIDYGLFDDQADRLLQSCGPNCLAETATKPKWIILVEFLFGGFNMLLWIGAILTFVDFGLSYTYYNEISMEALATGIFLTTVNLFTGFFGYYQETTSSSIMESFRNMVPKYATVIRNGEKRIMPSEEVVLGDLVEVNAGDVVPADIRIITSNDLKVDNSCITGESSAVSRGPDCTDTNPLESMNLAFYSTSVVQGSGTGIVIRCGENTVIGRIAGLTSSIQKDETLIRKELKYFVRVISVMAIIIGLTFFTVSMISGYSFFRSLSYFISISVANVPEGLPICLTASLSLTAKRMAKNNCMVKKLQAIETLGSCTVICSDKTGTLTQNKMIASHLYYNASERDVLTNFDSIDKENESYAALCKIATLCSRASFIDSEEVPIDQRKTTGDASESAILKIMEKLEGNVEMRRKEYPKVCEIPFNSVNKYQVSIHRLLEEKQFLLVMKGAPEKVLDLCKTILRDDEVLEINAHILKSIKKSIQNLGTKGERVLAFADLLLPPEYKSGYTFNSDKPNFPLKDLRFIGMISMIDPPRPSVPEAVSKCRSAGIRVIMVTGDHPVTAAAIARKVGIISPNALSVYDIAARNDVSLTKITENERTQCTAAVVTGADLRQLTETELKKILTTYKEIIFARTSPQQKLKIVEALQRMDMIVAVTGDGVNDSPALKKADIGIAMGITGTDVSKEAADMILLDDNFSSIVTGIEEGRLIFDNLKKSVAYALTSNVPEIAPFILMMALGIPDALSIMTILVIDVGTDLWPCISLAYEKPEADIMRKSPRNPKKDKLINCKLISLTFAQIGVTQAVASYAVYFTIMAGHGFFWGQLKGIRKQWEDPDVTDLTDCYGQEWTFQQRQLLTRKCIAGYFLALNVTQIADLLVCKTRRLSLFQQGMTNHVMNAGLMFQIFLALIMVYCPVLNTTLQFAPIEFVALLPTVPFAVFLLVYDELRKLLIRKYPDGFMKRETYY